MELTPLRAAGLFAALVFAVATIWVYRRGKIGNGDLLLRFAVFVIPLLALALEQFRATARLEEFEGGIAVVIPAYNEAAHIAQVIAALPEELEGLSIHAIVVDDGSFDDTTEAAREAGAAAVRLPMNRGQGAALRPGYRLALATRARLVVTMDADGQHQQSALPRLIGPILSGEADVVNGSRVLGDADPSHAARKLGITLFAWLLSVLTTSRITDPACGYRA